MYAQVEKPKENKSRAVANSVVQKKNGEKQGFGFEDNRQLSKTQFPRYQLGNEIGFMRPQIKKGGYKDKGRSENEQNNIIQMKMPLSKTGLNVVGESHKESEKRRDKEKKYAKEETGSKNYWTESEFRIRPWEITKDFFSDKRVRVDPFNLRFDYNQKASIEVIEEVLQMDDEKIKINVHKTLDVVEELIRNMWILIKNIESGSEGFNVKGVKKKSIIGCKGGLMKAWKKRSECQKINEEWYQGMEKKGKKTGKNIAHVKIALFQLKQELIDLGEVNNVSKKAEEILQERSTAMHRGVEKRFATKGVWKVGDEHIGHMRKMAKIENANMVDQADFNKYFKEWLNPSGKYKNNYPAIENIDLTFLDESINEWNKLSKKV